jgi:Tol biopolymer transport system component
MKPIVCASWAGVLVLSLSLRAEPAVARPVADPSDYRVYFPLLIETDIVRVSIATDGTQADRESSGLSLSQDGRYVAFSSGAGTLSPEDTDYLYDVFVYDRQHSALTEESVGPGGSEIDNDSYGEFISATGRFLAFNSRAQGLVPGHTRAQSEMDLYLRDRWSGTNQLIQAGVSRDGIRSGNQPVAVAIADNEQVLAYTSQVTGQVFAQALGSGQPTLVSVALDGTNGNGSSSLDSISSDGRLIAFDSTANNLVENDIDTAPFPNSGNDVFVYDRQTGITQLVSVGSNGETPNADANDGRLSGNGRVVVFSSVATNLYDQEAIPKRQIYARDLVTGETTLISRSPEGQPGNSHSFHPVVSDDGRFVAYLSLASNLVAEDPDQKIDVYVHDRQTGVTTLVSTGLYGAPANADSWSVSISGDGRVIMFKSDASNLVPDDTNGVADIFVWEW